MAARRGRTHRLINRGRRWAPTGVAAVIPPDPVPAAATPLAGNGAQLTATVRAEVLGGVWETIGSDRGRGIVVEDLVYEHDQWGPLGASFNLRRDPGFPWPDLGAFTPVEIEVGGVVVWDGRINQTPVPGNRMMNVQCEGWQFHLDDDQYERKYVHTRLGDWKDSRSFPQQLLTRYVSAPQVSSDRGALTIGWGKGTTVSTNDLVGVTLDLGPNCTAQRVVMTWDKNLADGSVTCYCWGTDSENANDGTQSQAFVFNVLAGTPGVAGGTISAKRYVHIFLIYTSTGGVYGQDNVLRITDMKVFAETAYEVGAVSVLKASDVVRDAVNRATTLLSADRSGIQTTSLNLPDLSPDEPKTPRQNWLAVDALHGWKKQIAVGRRPIYAPKAATPSLEIGPWASGDLQDGSANSGDEIYNRSIVTGTSPEGSPIRSSRFAGLDPAAPLLAVTSPSLPNPSFDTNTAGWDTWIFLPMTRDTTTFQTSPASGYFPATIDPTGYAETQFAGTFEQGLAYAIIGYMRATVDFDWLQMDLYTGTHTAGRLLARTRLPAGVANTWYPIRITWIPDTDIVNPYLSFAHHVNSDPANVYIESLRVFRVLPTLADRRNFVRTKQLPVQAPLPADLDVAETIGDLWLPGHKSTPFKGEREVVGRNDVREYLSGRTVEPAFLGLHTDELIAFTDRVDPDTGAWGREGRLIKTRYEHKQNKTAATIDSVSNTFEAALARLEAVVG